MEPKEAATYLWYLPALLTAGRLDEAEQVFSEAMKIEPRALMVENLRSVGNQTGQRFASLTREHAVWLFDRLIEAQPNDWRLRINAAELAIGEERWEDAHAAIDRAIELGPAKEIATRLFAIALRITYPRRSVPPTRNRGGPGGFGGDIARFFA
jgi:tetratricopeptide (TPR) repeat protein